MELGATICKPTSPLCNIICPIKDTCKAQASTSIEVTTNPIKAPKKPPKQLYFSVCVLSRISSSEDDIVEYLFVKRANKGLLANQWEFPNLEIDSADVKDNNCTLEVLWKGFPEYLLSRFGYIVSIEDDQGIKIVEVNNMIPSFIELLSPTPIVHVFSHQVHNMFVITCNYDMALQQQQLLDRSEVNIEYKWMTADQLIAAGITSGCKKILTAVAQWRRDAMRLLLAE